MGKPEKVECGVPAPDALSSGRLTERDQLGLLRMDGQPESVEPFRQYSHDPPCVFFVLAADDEIVGKPHDEAVPFHPWPDIPDKPIIQDMVEIDIRQHRGNDAAYDLA